MAVKYTEEQLNSVEKPFLIQLLLQQQEQLEAITKELHASNEKMQLLMEQVILGKQNRFGRSSEKMEDTSQICFCEVDGTIVFFNEAEAVCDLNAEEPEDLELKPSKQAKRKGKKEADLAGLPVKRIDHYLPEEELEAEFGAKGWKQLPDAISRKYHFVPAKVEVEEHHIGVYASKTDGHMVKADHPKALLHGSANVNHFFTLLGKMFFTSYGKEFFTYFGKQIFTSYGKYFFTLPGKQIFYIPVSPCGYRSGCFSR